MTIFDDKYLEKLPYEFKNFVEKVTKVVGSASMLDELNDSLPRMILPVDKSFKESFLEDLYQKNHKLESTPEHIKEMVKTEATL